MTRKRAVVICPGRGTYNKSELGYFHRHHADRLEMLKRFDDKRVGLGQERLTELDSANTFSSARHTRGDNASALIFACAKADYEAIDRSKFDIVAVTGNSMGWYIALACAGALETDNGFEVVNTMGSLMHEALIGGQLIYPYVDDDWQKIPGQKEELLALIEEISDLYLSIDLGGMIVFAGSEKALELAEKKLMPIQNRFPLRLHNHSGFHSPLQQPISIQGFEKLGNDLFAPAKVPLIDGRGHIWYPNLYDSEALREYTLGHQVVAPYDFAKAVRNSLFEFNPDVLIILGPGNTLGSSVAHTLVSSHWRKITDKDSFASIQANDPFMLAMGHSEQRQLVTG